MLIDKKDDVQVDWKAEWLVKLMAAMMGGMKVSRMVESLAVLM